MRHGARERRSSLPISQSDLRERGYLVSEVNAWEDDRSDDPLLTVIAAIEETLARNVPKSGKAKAHLERAKQAIAPVTVEIGKQIGSHLLKLGLGVSVDKLLEASKAGDTWEADEDVISQTTDAAMSALGKAYVAEQLSRHRKDRIAISTFREEVAEALESIEKPQPMFVFIDELDRCRPLYSVRLLDELKHIFEIPGLVFLVSSDSLQLSHSIKALYGSEFDSRIYLRRFFDRVMVFPPTDITAFVASALSNLEIDCENHFAPISELPPLEVLVSLLRHKQMTNRDILQYLEIFATFIHSWDEKVPIYCQYLAALTFDYFNDPRSFRKEIRLRKENEGEAKWLFPKISGNTLQIRSELSILEAAMGKGIAFLHNEFHRNDYIRAEYRIKFPEVQSGGHVPTSLMSYRDRIIQAGRGLEVDQISAKTDRG